MNAYQEPLPLAELLLRYRSAAKLSQKALAERATLSERTIADIEAGVSRWPRPITVSLIVEALGLPPDDRDALRLAASRRGLTGSDATHLAAAGASLFGRDAEMKRARNLLLEQGARLVTLAGGPGVGKTAVALAIARELAPDFDDNALVVDLAGIPDAKLVPTKVGLAAHIRDLRGEPVAASFAVALGRRKMLLILDTFEHVVAAAPFVAELIAASPTLTVVVTSRVALRLKVERTLSLSALALPQNADLSSAETVACVPSVAMLVACVRKHDPLFSVTQDMAPCLVALARALDGMPLAIELAAPRLAGITPAELAERTAHPLGMLVAERRTVAPRQRTMRGAIAWSYDLLSARQQCVFRRLGVFRGSFNEQAAFEVAAPGIPEPLSALQALAALVDQSLVGMTEDESGDARYHLHALVREFAAERLEQHGDYADT